MYAQLFDLLCDKALKVYHGELPIHVRFILDEFANIGKIPDFQKKISVIRSRNISASIILQSKSQLKAIYKDDMTTIIDNCDSYLFLGGSGKETLKDLEESLGKETIDMMTTSVTKGTTESHNMNYSIIGHNLKTQDEIFVMPRTKCILMLSGVNPFYSDKFDITKHKRYKSLSAYDKKNEFDVNRYVHTYRKAILKPDTKVTVINVGG
jgi:type IV secretion system protein VirD4